MKIKTIQFIVAALLSVSVMPQAVAESAALKEISMLSDQGNQSAALEKLDGYLKNNPNDAEALFMKGVIYVELDKRDDAIKAFNELINKFPNLPEPYNNLAVLYADKGAYDQARRALEKAIKTHPSYATAHENLGDIYARLASESYNKAFKLDNSNARAQNKLSMITDLFGAKDGKPAATVVAQNDVKPMPATKPAPEAAKPSPKASTPTATKPIVKAPVEPPVAKAPETKPAPVSEPTKATSENPKEDALAAVNAWAKAWAAQDVKQYLASYAKDFKPAKGMSLSAWKKQRRQRVSAPKRIRLSLSGTKVKMLSDDKAQVSFYQSYQGNGGKISTGKTLTLVQRNGNWLIQREKIGR